MDKSRQISALLLVKLIKAIAEGQYILSRLSLSNAQALFMCTHGMAAHCKK